MMYQTGGWVRVVSECYVPTRSIFYPIKTAKRKPSSILVFLEPLALHTQSTMHDSVSDIVTRLSM